MNSSIPEDAVLYARPVGLPIGAKGYSAFEVLWRSPATPTDVKSEFVRSCDLKGWTAALSKRQVEPLEALMRAINTPPTQIASRASISSQSMPLLMGIVNVTPDSFFDGGRHATAVTGIAHARQLIDEGADIIDVGGESTRPGANPVSVREELGRILPVIEGLKDCPVPISIDTRHGEVMKAAVNAGASIINDVSALRSDPGSMEIAAEFGCPVVLMHAGGEPKTMQQDPRYDHVLLDVYDFLHERIIACIKAGIDRSRLIVDPGIGFGKTLSHNMALIEGLSIFQGLGCPILFGASRKSFLAKLGAGKHADDRLAGSLSVALSAASSGAAILRVHDVAETRKALNVWMKMTEA